MNLVPKQGYPAGFVVRLPYLPEVQYDLIVWWDWGVQRRPHYCDNPPSEIVSLNIADIVILHENKYHHFMFSHITVTDKKMTFSSVQSRERFWEVAAFSVTRMTRVDGRQIGRIIQVSKKGKCERGLGFSTWQILLPATTSFKVRPRKWHFVTNVSATRIRQLSEK